MARHDPHFKLRIPDHLKERIRLAGIANDRSMTAEIVARLEASFLIDGTTPVDPEDAELAVLLTDLENLKQKLIRAHRMRK